MKLLKTAVNVAPKLLSAVSLVAGLSFAMGAHAETNSLGTLDIGEKYFKFDHGQKGSFTDTLNFNLGSLNNLSGGVASVYFATKKQTIFEITGLSMSFYDSQGKLLGSAGDGVDISIGNLGAGSYHATISGKATGNGGGFYGGLLSVSAVPEAETYAMMLAGLGVIGFIGRRRRQNIASAVIA